MLYLTRCYPIPPLTPLLCLCRNAQSPVAEIGAVAMTQLLEQLRPRVRDYAAPLCAGLRQPSLSFDVHVEHVLAELGASLVACDATTDGAFYAWVSITTTKAVLANHSAYRRLCTPRRVPSRAGEDGDTPTSRRDLGRGRAA